MKINVEALKVAMDKLGDKALFIDALSNSFFNSIEYLRGETSNTKYHRFTKRTGVLGSSVLSDVNVLKADIFIDLNKAPYGEYIYNGTKSRFIKPKNKRALAWGGEGGTFFSKGHKVKGWRADPFIAKTYNANKNKLIKMMQKDTIQQIEEYIKSK